MTGKTGIIYLQKDRLQLYSPYLSNILEFRFVPEISRDFDLYNKPLFEKLLNVFIINNKVPAGSFFIVIADNASFVKDFTSNNISPQLPQQIPSPQTASALSMEDLQNEANEFIEHVPFDEVAGKTYPLPNGVRAYATNKEMFEGIKNVIEKMGFIVEIVIPGFVFGSEVSAQPSLNINIINTIFQKINLVKDYNLLINPSIEENLVVSEENGEKEKSVNEVELVKKRESKNLVLIIGISVIALIFVITGIVLYLQFQEASPAKRTSTSSVAPISSPTILPTVATALTKDLTVQIVNATSSATVAGEIRQSLISYGFKTIELEDQSALGTAQNLLIFSPKVDTQTKTSVISDIRKMLGNVLIQEKSVVASDITIIIGK